jgi:hypothetical protein
MIARERAPRPSRRAIPRPVPLVGGRLHLGADLPEQDRHEDPDHGVADDDAR